MTNLLLYLIINSIFLRFLVAERPQPITLSIYPSACPSVYPSESCSIIKSWWQTNYNFIAGRHNNSALFNFCFFSTNLFARSISANNAADYWSDDYDLGKFSYLTINTECSCFSLTIGLPLVTRSWTAYSSRQYSKTMLTKISWRRLQAAAKGIYRIFFGTPCVWIITE